MGAEDGFLKALSCLKATDSLDKSYKTGQPRRSGAEALVDEVFPSKTFQAMPAGFYNHRLARTSKERSLLS